MAVQIQPPPNGPIGDTKNWRDWFFSVWVYATQVATNTFNGLNFTGSNIASIVTRNHNDLTSIQGGTSLQYYHLTNTEHTAVQSLGTISTQNSNSVSITGGSVTATLATTGQTTATTVGAAGLASAPPLPVGYIVININGTNYKIPYYNV